MTFPQAILTKLTPLYQSALDTLKRGDKLAPVAFVGSATGEIFPIVNTSSTEEDKDAWASHITRLAGIYNADFVCIMMESWSLLPKYVHLYKDILQKYGSVEASPYKLDVISISIETPEQFWMSQRPIRKVPPSKKRRAFYIPTGDDFQCYTEAAGRFAALLPNSKLVDPTKD